MISVDTVYQRVLATANKEQRGYITPQEFNLYANQAQMEIFEQYMNDKEDYNSEKIYPFTKNLGITNYFNLDEITDDFGNPNFYAIGSITTAPSPQYSSHFLNDIVVEEVSYMEYTRISNTPLTKPSETRPIYYVRSNVIYVVPDIINVDYQMSYISKPKKVAWTYVVVNSKPLYNPGASDHQNFQLHASEETTLVFKILQLAGIGIKDYNVVQVAAQKEVNKIQQEKQ
jgi:hypothetical protein